MGIKIVAVEDDENDALMLDIGLKRYAPRDWSWELVSEPDKGYSKALQDGVDVVISDYRLEKGRDGLDLLEKIHKVRPDIYLVLYTASLESLPDTGYIERFPKPNSDYLKDVSDLVKLISVRLKIPLDEEQHPTLRQILSSPLHHYPQII